MMQHRLTENGLMEDDRHPRVVDALASLHQPEAITTTSTMTTDRVTRSAVRKTRSATRAQCTNQPIAQPTTKTPTTKTPPRKAPASKASKATRTVTTKRKPATPQRRAEPAEMSSPEEEEDTNPPVFDGGIYDNIYDSDYGRSA